MKKVRVSHRMMLKKLCEKCKRGFLLDELVCKSGGGGVRTKYYHLLCKPKEF